MYFGQAPRGHRRLGHVLKQAAERLRTLLAQLKGEELGGLYESRPTGTFDPRCALQREEGH